MQFRSDPEFEEARINDLEDLVLQLQDRIEKLEDAAGITIKPDPTPVSQPKFTKATCRGCYALGTACGKCERCDIDPMNPKNMKSTDGQQIAKAIKAME